MAAVRYNFIVEQGATLLKSIVWKDSTGGPVNLTGFKARLQVRASVYAPTVLLELNTENGGITIDPTLGKLTIEVTPQISSSMPWRKGKYDLELESADGRVVRLMQGVFVIVKEITR